MPYSDKNCQVYYGDGTCSIEGSDATGVEIRYTGDVMVTTVANDTIWRIQGEDKIIVMSMNFIPLTMNFTPLTTVFEYTGELKVQSIIVTDGTDEISTTLHKIDNYTENINTNAEDLTIKSEQLGVRAARNTRQRIINYPILENQYTEDTDTRLHLEGGKEYHGSYHIHFKDGSAMTGALHSPTSQLLYYKLTIEGRLVNKLVPTTTLLAQKEIRKERRKMRSKGSIKNFIRNKKKNL